MNEYATHILVIDDADVVALCQQALQGEACVVHTLTQDEITTDSAVYQMWDVVLVGLHALNQHSVRMLHQLRHEYPDMPIVLYIRDAGVHWSTSTMEYMLQVIKLGVQSVLTQPFLDGELRDALASVLQKRQEIRTLSRYRTLIEHATDAILLLDIDGQRILDANSAAELLSGYSREVLLQTNFKNLLSGIEDREPAQQEYGSRGTPARDAQQPALAIHQMSSYTVNGGEIEAMLKTSDGRSIPISMSISLIPHDRQQFFLIVARNMSSRWQMVRQVIQNEKLAAIGRLISAIAHEVNNPLQAIHNSLHLLVSRSLSDEKRQRYLVMAQAEVEHLIGVVQRMLDFHRPCQEIMRPIDLHDLLKGVLKLVSQQLRTRRVRIVREWHPTLPQVAAIAGHLKQVYLNLVLNAIDSMPNGGVLTIRTYVTTEPEDTVLKNGTNTQVSLAMSGTLAHRGQRLSVVIEFSDTGHGIPPDELSKVFEPFYTTQNRRVGLGLSISYSIVQQHHGELSVSSAVGQGTTFRMRLPAAQT